MYVFSQIRRAPWWTQAAICFCLATFSIPILAAQPSSSSALGLQLGQIEHRDASAAHPQETEQQLPALQYYQGIPYITGGIGSDEANIFKQQRSQFPLSLNFGQTIGARTAFVADVQIVIRDAHQHTIFNINSEGPYCLIDLEPGQYELHATYMGHTESRAVTIQAGTPTEINIRWPEHL